MHCPNCGGFTLEDAIFCSSCGYPLLGVLKLFEDEVRGLTPTAKPVVYMSDLAYLFADHFLPRFQWVRRVLSYYTAFPSITVLPHSGFKTPSLSLACVILAAAFIELEAMKFIMLRSRTQKRFKVIKVSEVLIRSTSKSTFECDSIEHSILDRLEDGRWIKLSELVTEIIFKDGVARLIGSYKPILSRVKNRLHRKGLLSNVKSTEQMVNWYKGDAARALMLLDNYSLRKGGIYRSLVSKIVQGLLAPSMKLSIIILILGLVIYCINVVSMMF